MVLPVIIPLIRITGISFSESALVPQTVIDKVIISGINMNESVTGSVSSLNYSELLFWTWLVVAFALLIRTVIGVVRTLLIISKGEMIDGGKLKIVVSDLDHPPFSFYPFAVIPRDIYEQGNSKEIISHEEVHISQKHTIDLLISELFIAIFWFNPVSWLIRRSIILNHEYLADYETIHKSVSIKDYQYRLLNIPAGLRSIPLAHNFSSNIKNRIVMINKKSTHRYAALKNILFLLVVAILFVMFSFKPEPVQSKKSNQESLFSDISLSVLYNFIYRNISYPQEAKSSNDTGKVFVVIKMNKGGTIKESVAYTANKGITVPILDECFIVGYGPGSGQRATNNNNNVKEEHSALKAECLRVANKLGSCDIPEWKNKNMEFALSFNFQLK